MEDILDIQHEESSDPLDGPSLQYLRENGYNFSFGKYWETGWNAMKDDVGWYVLYGFLAGIISILVSFTYIGQYLIGGALFAGFFVYGAKVIRKEKREFGNFFDGFKDVGQLFIFSLLQTLASIVVFVPVILILGFNFDLFTNPERLSGYDPQDLLMQILPMYAVVFIGLILIYTFMQFCIPLIVLGRLSAVQSIKWSYIIISKNFFWFLLFCFVVGVISIAGVFACYVGLLFTIPFGQCLFFGAYKEIVGLGDKRVTGY
ncbi:MAG: hypothetical protein MK081_01460 [Flavobacteriales bacterium]|nr:hypothetical protein [Flavobacteriales bacterium]